MNPESDELDETVLDFIDDDDSECDIDSNIANTVLEAIENTLDDDDIITKDISFGVKLTSTPCFDWTEEYGTTFKLGTLVNIRGKGTIYKVIGFGFDWHTYDIKKSGDNEVFTENGSRLVQAPDGSVWEKYTDIHDPLKVPGLTITCPSNNRKFGDKIK